MATPGSAGAFPIATTPYGTGAAGNTNGAQAQFNGTTFTAESYAAGGFIPDIWSGKLVEKFYASTVLAAITNTDYEGEIKNMGDTVHIRTKPTIDIQPYTTDSQLTLQRPVGGNVSLLINQGFYFNTILDDVMDVQSDLNLLSMWSDDAAEQLKIKIDSEVLQYVYNTPVTQNMGATAGAISGNLNLGTTAAPLTIDSTNPSGADITPLQLILRMGQVLDEQNIPETGRWVVIPAWMATAIKLSELRQVFLSGDSVTMLRNGRLGMIDRFTIYVSNLLPNAGSTWSAGDNGGTNPLSVANSGLIYAGHAHGLTFASQVQKVETLRSEMTFGTILRGLQVYGRQTVDGKALVQAVVVPGAVD